jgi:hypothetical protein
MSQLKPILIFSTQNNVEEKSYNLLNRFCYSKIICLIASIGVMRRGKVAVNKGQAILSNVDGNE